jgi:NAD(P)H-hydrate epimerase
MVAVKPTVWLPEIAWDANKYTRGSLLVIAGSKRYPGAAILAAMAAERTGAGYVTLATPVPAAAVAQTRLLSIPVIATEATCAPKSPEGTFIATALTQIIDELRQIDAIACGPGLQACADTTGLVASLLALDRKSVV